MQNELNPFSTLKHILWLPYPGTKKYLLAHEPLPWMKSFSFNFKNCNWIKILVTTILSHFFLSFPSITDLLSFLIAPKIMAAKLWCSSADPPQNLANYGSKESSDRELSNELSFARFHGGSAPPHQIVEAMILDWGFGSNEERSVEINGKERKSWATRVT